MTRQLKAIFDGSTISTNSESMNIKSEPVFYVNKGTDGRYQDSKDSSRDGASPYPWDSYRSSRDQYPRDGYRHNSNMLHRSRYYGSKENFHNWGQKTNPLNKSGNISRCAMCQSIYHWANDCRNKAKEDFSNTVKITFFTQDVHRCYIEKFVGETLNCAVLDRMH